MNQKTSSFRIALTCALISLTAALTPARAQDVDYTGLQELYGEPVTTSAIGKPQTISETPISMDIVTAEEIQRSGAIDIPQILKRYAGMDVSRSFIGFADVNVRGYNQPQSNRLLVLINGRQVYQDIFGSTMWQSLPVQMSEIKQIEIVRGPNSSLFGFNATSGVVNIITYNPLRDDVDQVDLRYGSRHYREASGVTSEKITKNAGMRISANYTRSDDFERSQLFPGSLSSDDALQKRSISLDSQYNFSETTSARFEAGFVENVIDVPIFMQTAYDADLYNRYAKANLMHDAGDFGVWTLTAYHNSTDIELHGDPMMNRTDVNTLDNRLNVIQLSNIFSIANDHTFRVGAEYRDNMLRGTDIGATKDDKYSMNIYAINGMWDWRISDQLNWTAALRLDHWTTENDSSLNVADPLLNLSALDLEPSNTEYSYNTGLVYQPTQYDSFRASVGRGLHIPSLMELSIDAAYPASEIYGNPTLDAETNFTVDLGYARRLKGYDAQAGINLIYQKVDQVIKSTATPDAPLLDFTFENAGQSESYSSEFYLKGNALDGALDWHLNYTLMAIKDNPDTGRFLDFEGTQPRHKFNAAVGYQTGKWEFGADAHFVSSLNSRGYLIDLTTRYDQPVESYTQLNGRVAYNISDRTQIALDVFNVMEDHFERPQLQATVPNAFGVRGANEIDHLGILSLRHKF